MKIKEILREFAPNDLDPDGDTEMSPYVERMKNELVNYLSTLSATGAQGPIPTAKMVGFLKRQGYDVAPADVIDMLDGTAFSADPSKIDMKGAAPGVPGKGRDPEFNRKKVKSMANQKIKKDTGSGNLGDGL